MDLLQGDVENTRLAFCGSSGHISFGLPFTEYIPLKQLVHFSAKVSESFIPSGTVSYGLVLLQGQDLVVRHYAPPSSSSRESLFALSSANRYRWRVMKSTPPPPTEKKVKKEDNGFSWTDLSRTSDPSRPGPTSLDSSCSDPPDKERVQLLGHSNVSSQQHIITAPIIVDPNSSSLALELGEEGKESAHIHAVGVVDKEEEGDVVPVPRLVDKECFPMGSCDVTCYEGGWLDLACGPSITIDIEYCSHHHDPSSGEHTPLLPNLLRVDIDAPVALVRVFGCLARDLLGLKVGSLVYHIIIVGGKVPVANDMTLGELSWRIHQHDSIYFKPSITTSYC